METTYSQVDLTEILNTGLFTEEWAETQTNWLDNPGDAWETNVEKYGFESFAYRVHPPFHPARFYDFFCHEGFADVVRSKGHV